MLIKGTNLNQSDQQYVLSAYVHRFTGDHKPAWANGIWKDGKTYPLQFANDAEWLANTEFHVTKHCSLDKRHNSCFSNPTWPHNPELRK